MLEGLVKMLAVIKAKLSLILKINSDNTNTTNNFSSAGGSGGRGGHATVQGSGYAKGGPGGKGCPHGNGGDGGNAHVVGDGIALGGEGGEAGQLTRGGRGGRSAAEAHGVPNIQLPDGSWLWDYGRGGDGASSSTTDTTQST